METAKRAARLGKTLLIVEDDILPAMALKDELEDAGYRVLELTGRVSDAVAAAIKDKPDLALVNIELQGHDDGIPLALELKAMGVPSLFISGQVSRARSAKTVAVASLPKPYRATDAVAAVDFLLGLLDGKRSGSPPSGLELFDEPPAGITPKAA